MSITDEAKVIKKINNLAGDYKCWDNKINHEESLTLCNLLEELQQYIAIGSVEQFQVLKEKSEPKDVIYNFIERLSNETVYECFCPTCNSKVKDYEHHCECGQTLNWRKKYFPKKTT